jgi:hypothetical protein
VRAREWWLVVDQRRRRPGEPISTSRARGNAEHRHSRAGRDQGHEHTAPQHSKSHPPPAFPRLCTARTESSSRPTPKSTRPALPPLLRRCRFPSRPTTTGRTRVAVLDAHRARGTSTNRKRTRGEPSEAPDRCRQTLERYGPRSCRRTGTSSANQVRTRATPADDRQQPPRRGRRIFGGRSWSAPTTVPVLMHPTPSKHHGCVPPCGARARSHNPGAPDTAADNEKVPDLTLDDLPLRSVWKAAAQPLQCTSEEKQKRREGRRVARPRCRRSSVRIARIGPQRVIRAVSGCLVALGRSRRAAFWPMFMDGPD